MKEFQNKFQGIVRGFCLLLHICIICYVNSWTYFVIVICIIVSSYYICDFLYHARFLEQHFLFLNVSDTILFSVFIFQNVNCLIRNCCLQWWRQWSHLATWEYTRKRKDEHTESWNAGLKKFLTYFQRECILTNVAVKRM